MSEQGRVEVERLEGRRTLEDSRRVEGTGLHTGRPVTATVGPGEAGEGIVFRRTDLDGRPVVKAAADRVTGVEWTTTLGSEERGVRAVEHVLAALTAAGVDDAEVTLEGPEPPALDGSAAPWCDLLREAGTAEGAGERAVLRVGEPFTLEEGDSRYTVSPHARCRVSAEIEFDHPFIGRQFASTEVTPEPFCRDVAPARTFGFEGWREELEARGLARGASPENTLVLEDDGLAGGQELRFPDEFVRHKLVDLVGDLALAGARLEAHVAAERPGHRGNVALARALVARMRTAEEGPALDVQDILDHIPHRYPFLLVDRVLGYEAGERIVGLKNVTINEPFFQGHFPGHPIMPGVLIVEAMAQVGGLLLMHEFEDPREKVVYFMALDDVKFRRPVRPGDRLRFEVEMLQLRRRVCRMKGVALVDGQNVTEAEMMAQVVDR